MGFEEIKDKVEDMLGIDHDKDDAAADVAAAPAPTDAAIAVDAPAAADAAATAVPPPVADAAVTPDPAAPTPAP